MALSLSAEQRNLLEIFKREEQYVIPAYQRPYSWEYDHCFQLYNDLIDAFNDKNDYFVGNVIIAKSETDKSTLEVIDGQQRLTTLLLMIKVIHILIPDLKVLGQMLEKEDWKGIERLPRLRSDIFEASDRDDFESVIHYDKIRIDERFVKCRKQKGDIDEKKCINKFEINLLRFYNWFTFYDKENPGKLESFVEFLLNKVYMLPIELTGKTHDEASEKALVIFETINNRGMNLEDADIFKAKLYEKAKRIGEDRYCIERWTEFKNSCEKLNIKSNDIFRYYSHIIRGRESITTNEENLRHFFIRHDFSPFAKNKYAEIFDDLFKIVEIIERINLEKNQETQLAKWLQILDFYSNQYPKYALVNYIFVHGIDEAGRLIDFLKGLIRYTFYQGPTSSVKFEIFNMIRDISLRKPLKDYYSEHIEDNHFDNLGRLKYGFALLAFYLKQDNALRNYSIDKILNLKEAKLNEDDNSGINYAEDIGNFIVLDIVKKNTPIEKKLEYYKKSTIEEVRNLGSTDSIFDVVKNRNTELKDRLVKFFKGNNE